MKIQEILKYPLNFGFITTTLNRNKQEICKKLHKNVLYFQNILTNKYLTISTINQRSSQGEGQHCTSCTYSIARPATAVGAPSVDGGVAEDDEVPNVVIPHNLLASLGQSRCG